MLEDTIVALSTPAGRGGLGIVRLSGPRAAEVAGRIFRSAESSTGTFPDRRALIGEVVDPETDEVLDEAVLTYFAAPRSYTREDVVEIGCHGSPVVLEAVIRLGIREGARAAEPGEFTLRAFLHGRIDLLQAEAVDDLIRAATPAQARVSGRQLAGSLSRRVTGMTAEAADALADLEAGLEFPDDQDQAGARDTLGIAARLRALAAGLARLAGSHQAGRALAEVLTLAIVGRPNVGKSTLFNALLGADRAIVTPRPGTTRDYLREKLVLGDAVFELVDTAGVKVASHPAERAAVEKAGEVAAAADGVLIVLDAASPARRADSEILARWRSGAALVVFNKSDLPVRWDDPGLPFGAGGAIAVSALTGANLDGLRQAIRAAFAPAADLDDEIVLRSRQRALLEEMRAAAAATVRILEEGAPEETAAEELRGLLGTARRLTGDEAGPDVIERIFSRFCVGK